MVPATSPLPQQNPSSHYETEFPSGTRLAIREPVYRERRSGQRRQVHPVQRADPGRGANRQLAVRGHRAERRPSRTGPASPKETCARVIRIGVGRPLGGPRRTRRLPPRLHQGRAFSARCSAASWVSRRCSSSSLARSPGSCNSWCWLSRSPWFSTRRALCRRWATGLSVH
jgi:hypothetical protein